LPFTAPWLQLTYGLFYTRKKPLSRVAQLFMTQLRQVEAGLQAREQRALSRLEGGKKSRRRTTKVKPGSAGGAGSSTRSSSTGRRARSRR